MRSLSPEEAQLWSRVTATIRPLSRERKSAGEPQEPPELAGKARPPKFLAKQPKPARAANAIPIPIHERTLDNSWDRRLRSGSVEPDRTLDLHGMNLETAWTAIDRTLDQAIAHGDRLILLITGHHRPGDPPIQRGRIRAAVHDWLAASRHSSDIAAVRAAHRRHGGGGSLYLVLRRGSRTR
ncbi:MAG TPA: Smr/MutS family protein [Sphingomicrobium sp.]|nr:Smr/MutS family protein [Sphingomicrobium sp.]